MLSSDKLAAGKAVGGASLAVDVVCSALVMSS